MKTTKGGGHNRLEPGSGLCKPILIPIGETLRDKLDNASARAGMSRAAFVRMLIEAAVNKCPQCADNA